MLENEMDNHAENLKSIVEQGREMAKAGHFDSAGILKKVDAFDKRSDDNSNDSYNPGKNYWYQLHWNKNPSLGYNYFFLIYRFEALKAPVANRRRKLEDSLKLHQFNFDADSEMQWIKEHIPAATSTDYGKNLIDVQNKHKKHKVKISKVDTFSRLFINLKFMFNVFTWLIFVRYRNLK